MNHARPLENPITVRHIPKESIPFSNDVKERCDNELFLPSDYQIKQNEYRTSLVDYIQSKDWDYFFTVTFRSPRGNPYSVLRDIQGAIPLNAIQRAFIAIEPHTDNPKNYHAHGLARSKAGCYHLSPSQLWRIFFTYCGRSDVQAIRGGVSVANYCSKYVVKMKGEWDFWGNWR